MLLSLAGKHRKKVAAGLLVTMYLQCTLPVLATRNNQDFGDYKDYRNYRKGYSLNYFFPSASKYDRLPDIIDTIGKIDHSIPVNHNNQKNPGPDIGGPGQPEMSSFKSVNSDNMVDLFTGDFSYNIPLMDVGGYPVNIHYSSGVSMDQEASWVGLGWNINPGTVSRNMRGVPDDFNGNDSITRVQNIRRNKTVGVNIAGDLEIVGLPINVGINAGVFHNNYNGWGLEYGVNASINAGGASAGSLTAGLGIQNNSQTGLDIQPSLHVGLMKKDLEGNGRGISLGMSTNYNSRSGISALQLSAEIRTGISFYVFLLMRVTYFAVSFGYC